jgi:uncharacterized lipoprotein YmbA
VTELALLVRRPPLAVALLFAMTGCARLPARELYRLAVVDSIADPLIPLSSAPRPVLPGSLAIAPYVTPGVYGDPSIVYRIGETQYGVYPAREWALPLGEQLGMLTEDVLRRTPLTTEQAIFRPASPRVHTYLWRGSVRRFDEVDRGKQVYASAQLDAQLVRVADDSVVWRGSATLERLVPEPTMPAIVATLSAIADELVEQLVNEARAAAAQLADIRSRGLR